MLHSETVSEASLSGLAAGGGAGGGTAPTEGNLNMHLQIKNVSPSWPQHPTPPEGLGSWVALSSIASDGGTPPPPQQRVLACLSCGHSFARDQGPDLPRLWPPRSASSSTACRPRHAGHGTFWLCRSLPLAAFTCASHSAGQDPAHLSRLTEMSPPQGPFPEPSLSTSSGEWDKEDHLLRA